MFASQKIVKFAVSGLVGVGASRIIGSIIADHVNPEELTVFQKVTTYAGAWAIGGLVTQASKEYTNKIIDDVYAAVDELKTSVKLARINRKESTFETEGLRSEDYHLNPETDKYEPLKTDAS